MEKECEEVRQKSQEELEHGIDASIPQEDQDADPKEVSQVKIPQESREEPQPPEVEQQNVQNDPKPITTVKKDGRQENDLTNLEAISEMGEEPQAPSESRRQAT